MYFSDCKLNFGSFAYCSCRCTSHSLLLLQRLISSRRGQVNFSAFLAHNEISKTSYSKSKEEFFVEPKLKCVKLTLRKVDVKPKPAGKQHIIRCNGSDRKVLCTQLPLLVTGPVNLFSLSPSESLLQYHNFHFYYYFANITGYLARFSSSPGWLFTQHCFLLQTIDSLVLQGSFSELIVSHIFVKTKNTIFPVNGGTQKGGRGGGCRHLGSIPQ